MGDAEAIIDRDVEDDAMERGILVGEIMETRGRLRVVVFVKARKRTPTQKQHAYYRSVVAPIARRWLNETQGGMPDGKGGFRDFTKKESHEWWKDTLLGQPIVHPKTGEVLQGVVSPSCAELSEVQMFDFTEAVADTLRSFGARVPLPDKDWKEARERARKEQSNELEPSHS